MINPEGKNSTKLLKTLLDSGASSSVISSRAVTNQKTTKSESTSFLTMAGTFNTTHTCSAEFQIPELNQSAKIASTFHVTQMKGNYDVILGRDVLAELGILIDFRYQTVSWNDASIDMKPTDCTQDTSYYAAETGVVAEATSRISKILDAKYSPADLEEVANKNGKLTVKQQEQLLTLLNKHKPLFDGTLGRWHGDPYRIELRENAKPHHAHPYSIPHAYEATLKMEVERLCKVGVLKKINRSEWAAPTFIIPKKDRTVRFISDFRELNKRIKRKPFPIPKIQDLLLKLENFQYATSLDLNMGYYHIELAPESKRLCTIVLPWGKYEYQKLPMGLCNSPDIFQEKMSELFAGFDFVRTYIDDLLIISKGSFEDHLSKVDSVLIELEKAGLKVNATKSAFAQEELEYLGYWITREGILPLQKKIDAIQNIARPTNVKELRSFIGLVNYYRDMWKRRSEILAPLTALTSSRTKWKWTDIHQHAFDRMKRTVSRETLLAYPDFTKPFEVHTDASDYQLGSVISQNGRPVAFYSRKLNPAQTRYTTTEKELLAIVETLKEFKNILLGQEITVYTDHKNLTYKTHNSTRVMRWRLTIEEFGPTLIYIPGEKNIVADSLSRLPIIEMPTTQSTQSAYDCAEIYALTKEEFPPHAHPLSYKTIMRHQQEDRDLLNNVRTDKNYVIKDFTAAKRVRKLICLNNKIVVPKTLQKHIVQWYHVQLCHPGMTRTELTIRQHFTWGGLSTTVKNVCASCHTCQLTKTKRVKYGKLPEKEAEAVPWDVLCIDLIGPYKIINDNQTLTLWALTMIDPATGWFDMSAIKTKQADVIANALESTWLCKYPRPTTVIMDRGTEFMAEVVSLLRDDYDITRKLITTRNPQANAILERAHQTIGNIIRTFQLSKAELNMENPWEGILSAVIFAMRSTVHTTLGATPMQLVFGRDAILNLSHEANWQLIKIRKQELIKKNNERENNKRVAHTYKPGELVLIKNERKSKYANDAYQGPWTVTTVNDNGTVNIQKGIVNDQVNIRNVHPYVTS